VGSEEVEIVSAAGGGSPALPELEPPQALKRPSRAASTITARDEVRMGCKGRERRFIGFMGLEIPISVHGITRGIFLYYFTGGERLLMMILNKQSNSRNIPQRSFRYVRLSYRQSENEILWHGS
jgi:hypothetical protein